VRVPWAEARRRAHAAARPLPAADRPLAEAGRGTSPVTPAVVGLAAAVGLDTLPVRARPAVALLVTGDELVDAGGSAAGPTRWSRRR
jgi:molybdopterin molybdotransferase